MLDRYGNPIDEIHPMTRDLINYFAERFEAIHRSERDHRETEELLDELIRHEHIHNNIHIVQVDGHYGVYDKMLETMLVPVIYEKLIPIGSDSEPRYYIARRNEKYGFVRGDVIGTEMQPFVYDSISPLGEHLDLFVYEKGHQQGLLSLCNYHCFEILPATYDNITQYPDTPFVRLHKDGKVGLWGMTLPIPPLYDEIYVPPYFGWLKVKKDDHWGYIDNQGNYTDDKRQAFLCYDADRYWG